MKPLAASVLGIFVTTARTVKLCYCEEITAYRILKLHQSPDFITLAESGLNKPESYKGSPVSLKKSFNIQQFWKRPAHV
jgi:hypothetical protein